jgi:hypothetical protein
MLDKYYGFDYTSIFGYQIIAAPYMADKVQARIHKKKRINKKWRKRYGMRDIPWKKFFIEGNRIYCHPKMVEKLRAEIYMR